jgi:hypothetical protein
MPNFGNEQVSIKTLFLANHVEAVNDLLYVSGGGWTIHTRVMPSGNPPPQSQLGVALIMAVPWHQMNREHKVVIEIRDEDGKSIAGAPLTVKVERTPRTRPGTMEYARVAGSINLIFPHPGGYEVVAQVEGIDGSQHRWPFQVEDKILTSAK